MSVRSNAFRRWRGLLKLGVLLGLLLPCGISILLRAQGDVMALNWRDARSDSTGQAPDPGLTREAVVQVYAARAFGWRGALGVHTWIALKPSGADHYLRIEVVGWGVRRGYSAVRVARGIPDAYSTLR